MEHPDAGPILCTERLRLRPLHLDDVSALHGFWTDPKVRRYLWDNEIIPRERVEEIVEDSMSCFRELGTGLFAIEARERPGTLIGFCGHRRQPGTGHIELLYGILPAYWGEGLVTEAALEVLRHGFESCGIPRVVGATDTPNQRSVRVMQRIGMVFEERRQYKGLDTVFYSVTPQDLAVRR
jgi:[ribosomal protein S5]-alanine N-acetyltransferase